MWSGIKKVLLAQIYLSPALIKENDNLFEFENVQKAFPIQDKGYTIWKEFKKGKGLLLI